MKKVISLLIVAVMIMLSLSSCDIVNNFLPKSTTEEVRTTITKEEWAILDDIINYTLKATGTESNSVDGETETVEHTYTFKATETTKYEKSEETYKGESKSFENYFVTEDGVKYKVQKYSNTWYASKCSWKSESLFEFIFNNDSDITFDNLTYDKNKKAYIYTEEIDGEVETYTFHFKDGTLTKIEGEIIYNKNGEFVEERATMIISDIGTTSITVPEYTIRE